MIEQPSYIEKFGGYYLLWFEVSNTYSCIDEIFHSLLELFFTSNSQRDFIKIIVSESSMTEAEAEDQYIRITSYLEACNQIETFELNPKVPIIHLDSCTIHKYYSLNTKSIRISANDQRLIDLLHPIIAHLEIEKPREITLILNILKLDNQIILFSENTFIEAFNLNEYHKLQGKVIMSLLNVLHNKKDEDWVGLLHASAVEMNNQGIIFFGASGSGKSTLVSLLAADSAELLADDLVPLLSENQSIYQNPSAVSVKQSSLPISSKLWPNTQTYTKGIFTKGKGEITYIPMQSGFMTTGITCKYMIKVNYQNGVRTLLEPLDFKEALETLIPESWLQPNPSNARSFINWMNQVHFFELTYSKFEEVTPLLHELTKN